MTEAHPSPVIFIAGRDVLTAKSGGVSYARAHARAAMAAGYEPHLFSVAESSSVVKADFGTAHRVRTPFRPRTQGMVPGHSLVMAPAIVAFVRQRRLRRVIIHSFGTWGAIAASAADELRRDGCDVRLVTNSYTTYRHEARGKLRGLSREYGLARWTMQRAEYLWALAVMERFERRAYESADALVVNYRFVQRLIEQRCHAGLPIRLLPYTTETAFLPPCAVVGPCADGGPPMIVAVSRHDPRKGLDTLLRALGHLRDEGVAFRAVLAGGGALLEPHRRLAHSLGLGRQVSLPGVVPDARTYLARATCFVLPSLQEGSGSVSLLEAMEAGVPSVVSRCDGLVEDAVDEESALFTSPGDDRALARTIRRVLDDRELQERLRAGARAAFEARFNPGRFVDALAKLYGELGLDPVTSP